VPADPSRASRSSHRRARWLACAVAVGSVAAIAACSAGGAASSAPTNAGAGGPGVASTGPTTGDANGGASQDPTPAGTNDASQAGGLTTASPASACVTQVYGQLTLAQRVGQLFLVAPTADIAGSGTKTALSKYHFGSILLPANADGTSSLAAATAAIQALAPADTDDVRFLIGANQEGGQIQQLTGPGFDVMPSALVQGSWTTSALRNQASIWGSQLHAAGVNLNLAPVMDTVPAGTASTNAPIGQLDREFGSDPQANGEHGVAFIDGMATAGVASVPKHFPGLGRVVGNTDFTADVIDSVTTSTDPYLASYRDAIDAGVPYMMVAEATYTKIDPNHLAVFSPVIMGLLRNGLGFNGVIVSDDLGVAAAVASIPAGQRALDFLNAGGDLITSQKIAPAEQMASTVLATASSDSAFRATVDAAARRVLAAKQAQGLLPC
jgi:beta-N-acetylhexosaminidase